MKIPEQLIGRLGEDSAVFKKAPEPNLCVFNGFVPAIKLITEHIRRGSIFGIYADVDTDGVMAALTAREFLLELDIKRVPEVGINSVRQHGISTGEAAGFVRDNGIEILLVVDSGLSYALEALRNEKSELLPKDCDIVFLDHHEGYLQGDTEVVGLSPRSLSGERWVNITSVNKTPLPDDDIAFLKNSINLPLDLIPEHEFSGCGVVYEFFSLLFAMLGKERPRKAEQFTGVSLLSDVIDINNPRGQYYLRSLTEKRGLHSCLYEMFILSNKYFEHPNKEAVSYSLSPAINRLIRAGKTDRLLPYMNGRGGLSFLSAAEKAEIQSFVEQSAKDARVGAAVAVGALPEDKGSYTGLVAADIMSKHNKPTFVFMKKGGIYSGSFRGPGNLNYLDFIRRYIYAAGHQQAFGMRGTTREVNLAIKALAEALQTGALPGGGDESQNQLRGISVGCEMTGTVNIPKFERKLFERTAMYNAGVSSKDELAYFAPREELSYIRSQGRLCLFDWHGLECKSMTTQLTKIVRIYPEYVGRELNIWLSAA